ncbi:MAG TPA: farnesyl diphosphate synthase [Pyrinomonadaceae bacterium]|nr:farnesyl diphosphate synthase [Pyrinomonadaceae bacterium]
MSSDVMAQSALELEFLMARNRSLVEVELNRLLPSNAVSPERVNQAIRWSVFAGGKRFRPALLLATGQTFGASIESLLNSACAFEMIHTYSLIHDDLPSMDDDELRRGRPTCHIRFDEATAILAGDALQTLAFQTIAQDDFLTDRIKVGLIAELAKASGTPEGMVAGQALDIEAEARQVSAGELEEIHRLKTGALIVAAARAGALIAEASANDLSSVSEYAAQLGLLFQITDDLLDVTATAEDLGKTPGKDARSAKATYPGLYGLEETKAAASLAHTAACAALAKIDRPTDTLRLIADYILNRPK